MSYELEAVFDSFTDEQAGRLIKAVFDYEKRGELPEFEDPLLKMIFDTVIRQKSDANAEAYKLRCEQQRKNAEKRWKGKKNMPSHTTAYNGMPNMPPHADDAKHADIDIDIDKSISIKDDAAKLTEEFLQLTDGIKIATGKKLNLMRKYREMRQEAPKEEVDRQLLDYLGQE